MTTIILTATKPVAVSRCLNQFFQLLHSRLEPLQILQDWLEQISQAREAVYRVAYVEM